MDLPIDGEQTSLNLSTGANPKEVKQAKPSSPSKKNQGGQGIIKIPRRCRKEIEGFFDTLKHQSKKITKYRKEWGQQIAPSSDHSRLNRWRFAFCTVHTPWLPSCEQFQDIQCLYENVTPERLAEKLSLSGGGMHRIKAEGINNLHELWNTRQELFDFNGLTTREEWQNVRNKLTNKLTKLGSAKTSFAIEMLRPLNAQVICIDRHMFKAFGWQNVDKGAPIKQYEYYESYWLELCKEYKIEPAICRNLYWDIIQQQPSSMYWGSYLNEYVYTTSN